ncbi:RNA-directed DNA polymerase, eukaryota, reverse transcriptase zinc-binding domain protein [Tanacetum coccineum]
MELQPSSVATSKWSKEMMEYFKKRRRVQCEKDKNEDAVSNEDTNIELDENDVYVVKSRTAKFMTAKEVSAILKIPQVMKKKNKSFRLAKYVTDKIEFKEFVKKNWDISLQGHAMYKLVKKLNTIKPHLNKLNWKNRNLFGTVSELKSKLQSIQKDIDKDATNKTLRAEGVEVLREFKEPVGDEEKLIMSVCAEDGKRYDNCDVAEQFVKHFEGPDGYTSKFFKRSWDIVRSDFCTVIKEFFSSGKLLGEVNETLISLIPKSLTPQKVSDFRPIACCDVIYKCISKILTNRIKLALNQIVDDNQSAFIPGRAITYNILLTQELLKGYNYINGPKRCSFKIDIQKAYDTVSWSFIEEILGNVGFPCQMIKWIMTCISTPKFTIYVNGERYGYFKGGRGLRQRDPISPYIFTMVIEVLNLLVENEIRKENAFKYHFGCKQLKITHLCFAYDLIMLSHGDKICVTVLRNALNEFSIFSGLYPNLSKFTMFCGSLDDDTRSEISCIFPFTEGKLPVRYLGVPLVTKKIGVADCKQLVDKNSGDSCKGKAKVAWKEVCKPKDQGGIGFKSLELWNKTLLVKHLWNVASRKESLWVKWINVVKLKKISVWDVSADSKDSWGWKCPLKLRSCIGDHMRYRIGDGNSINVWHDKWHEGISLSSLFSKKEIFYARFKDHDKIKDVVGENGWKRPHNWIIKYPWLANLQVPAFSNSPDKAIWIDNSGSERRFSTNIY